MDYDIALIMVPPWQANMPPLGLAYICEYLKSRGFKPKVLDFNLELSREASYEKRIFWEIHNINSMPLHEIITGMFNSFRNEIDGLVNQIISLDCDLVGFSVNVASIGLAAKIATLIKERNEKKRIIFGGTGCFWEESRKIVFPEDRGSIDAFVVGEGEETLERIINNYKKGKAFEGIEGAIYKKDDFLKSANPFYTQDIDKLPFPTFSDFELSSYRERRLPMLISRGCIGRCVFCIDHLMCGIYRYRSPEKIIEEIKYHINTNKINNFGFCDLICNGNLKQLEKLCDLIIQSELKINWGSYAMVRKDMTLGLLEKMRKAGCVSLCYGLESASSRTLKKMNKFYSVADAERIVRLTHEAGILAAINIIVGFPGETEDEFAESVSFIKRNKNYISEVTNISSFVIMSHSKLGTHPEEYEINLPLPKGFNNSYIDKNGVDLDERTRRVRKTVFVTSNLDIRNIIVNYCFKNYMRKKSLGLIFCPVAQVGLLPRRLAYLSAYLHQKDFSPFIYDFNIKLYRAVPAKFKNLWDYQNWHLWSLSDELLNIFNLWEKELFGLMEELVSLETNVFCFLIEKENLMFSLKIAAIFRKYNPNASIIFSNPNFNDNLVQKLVPRGVVDFFIFAEERATLRNILDNFPNNAGSLSNSVIYKDGKYISCDRKEYVEDKKENSVINFKEMGLIKSDYSHLPLQWDKS